MENLGLASFFLSEIGFLFFKTTGYEAVFAYRGCRYNITPKFQANGVELMVSISYAPESGPNGESSSWERSSKCPFAGFYLTGTADPQTPDLPDSVVNTLEA